jgi:hypothetical protein
MNPIYFKTHFRSQPGDDWSDRPEAFAIITAYPTTGQQWPQAEVDAADNALEQELHARAPWVRRLTGYDPDTLHAEPGWAAAIDFAAACEIGNRFRQDAIYFVDKGTLYVSYCDSLRKPERVAGFDERLGQT